MLWCIQEWLADRLRADELRPLLLEATSGSSVTSLQQLLVEAMGLPSGLLDEEIAAASGRIADALRPKLLAATTENSASSIEALIEEAKQQCPGLLNSEISAATSRIIQIKAADVLRPKLVAATKGNSAANYSSASVEALIQEARQQCPGLLDSEVSAAMSRVAEIKAIADTLRAKLVAATKGNSIASMESLIRDAKQQCPGLVDKEVSAAAQRLAVLKALSSADTVTELKAALQSATATGTDSEASSEYQEALGRLVSKLVELMSVATTMKELQGAIDDAEDVKGTEKACEHAKTRLTSRVSQKLMTAESTSDLQGALSFAKCKHTVQALADDIACVESLPAQTLQQTEKTLGSILVTVGGNTESRGWVIEYHKQSPCSCLSLHAEKIRSRDSIPAAVRQWCEREYGTDTLVKIGQVPGRVIEHKVPACGCISSEQCTVLLQDGTERTVKLDQVQACQLGDTVTTAMKGGSADEYSVSSNKIERFSTCPNTKRCTVLMQDGKKKVVQVDELQAWHADDGVTVGSPTAGEDTKARARSPSTRVAANTDLVRRLLTESTIPKLQQALIDAEGVFPKPGPWTLSFLIMLSLIEGADVAKEISIAAAKVRNLLIEQCTRGDAASMQLPGAANHEDAPKAKLDYDFDKNAQRLRKKLAEVHSKESEYSEAEHYELAIVLQEAEMVVAQFAEGLPELERLLALSMIKYVMETASLQQDVGDTEAKLTQQMHELCEADNFEEAEEVDKKLQALKASGAAQQKTQLEEIRSIITTEANKVAQMEIVLSSALQKAAGMSVASGTSAQQKIQNTYELCQKIVPYGEKAVTEYETAKKAAGAAKQFDEAKKLRGHQHATQQALQNLQTLVASAEKEMKVAEDIRRDLRSKRDYKGAMKHIPTHARAKELCAQLTASQRALVSEMQPQHREACADTEEEQKKARKEREAQERDAAKAEQDRLADERMGQLEQEAAVARLRAQEAKSNAEKEEQMRIMEEKIQQQNQFMKELKEQKKQMEDRLEEREAAGEEEEWTEAERSKYRGVSAAYIINDLLNEVLEMAKHIDRSKLQFPDQFDPNDPSFHEIADGFAYGATARGKGHACPRDGIQDCALVDALYKEGKAGRATIFLSWVWKYKIRMFIETIRAWIEQSGKDPETTYIWICFFCNNQFRLDQANADDLDTIFEGRLKSSGQMIAMLDEWEVPEYVKRIWCVYEQFTAAKLGIPVTMIMPPDQTESLNNQLAKGKEGIEAVQRSLTNIDVERAQASYEKDEKKVKEMIRNSVGFEAVNAKVKESMANWCGTQLSKLLSAFK